MVFILKTWLDMTGIRCGAGDFVLETPHLPPV